MDSDPKRMLRTPLPLQGLLLWQTGGLVMLSGVVAAWHPWSGCIFALLIFWLDTRARNFAVVTSLFCCLLIGFLWGNRSVISLHAHLSKPLPAWALTGKEVLIEGKIRSVQGLVDNRLRLILEDVHPVNIQKEQGLTPLPGALAWTREGSFLHDFDSPSMLPGQYVQARLQIRGLPPFYPERSFNSAMYWGRQGVSALAWSRTGNDEHIQVSGKADPIFLWRENIRQAVLQQFKTLYPQKEVHKRGYGQSALSAPHGWGVVVALIFGDRRYLGQDDSQIFAHAGLAHSLALSGQHLAVVGLFALMLAKLCAGKNGKNYTVITQRLMMLALSVPLVALYLWLGAAPPSLVRAAIMLAVLVYCTFTKRISTTLDAVLFAFFVFVLVDPTLLFDTGLRLSFAAVAGIVLLMPLFMRRLYRLRGFTDDYRRRTYQAPSPPMKIIRTILFIMGSVLACSFAVHVASGPLMMWIFGRMTPWGVLNVFWLPVLGAWVLPFAFGGILLLTPAALFPNLMETWLLFPSYLGRLCLWLAAEPCHWLMRGLESLDSSGMLKSFWGMRPHWTAIFGVACLFLAFCLLIRRPKPTDTTMHDFPFVAVRKLLFVGACLLCVGPLLRAKDSLYSKASLHMLDVGQGQAIVIEGPGQDKTLVDGGGLFSHRFDTGRDIITPWLTHNKPLRIQNLMLSHPHTDHIRGLLFLAKEARVDAVMMPSNLMASPSSRAGQWLQELEQIAAQRHIPTHILSEGHEIVLSANLVLEVLYPPPRKAMYGNDSMIVRLVQLVQSPVTQQIKREGLALLTGDAPKDALNELVHSGKDLRATVLVAPHHGSDSNFVPAFIKAVAPTEVWVSCSKYNSYSFPGKDLQFFLRQQGIVLRTTANEGNLAKHW